MNQEKIGKFIAECRKSKNLTQEQLAEKLNITSKAVSKWECGKSLPDASIMIDLCNILEISVNDLLSGEIIQTKDYQNIAETNLIELQKQIDKTRRTFNTISYIFGTITILMFVGNIILNSIYRDAWDNSLYRALGLVICFIACIFWFAATVLNFKSNQQITINRLEKEKMKRFLKEIIILLIQLFMFYISPLFAGPTDVMGMVFLILLSTFILSIIIASIFHEKVKYLYPVIISLLFIPSVFIYYNDSALIHAVWYFVVSTIGLLIGTIIYKIANK